MDYSLARNWWVLALRGVLAILFGVFAFVYPGLTWLVLAAVFGAFAMLDGIFAITSAITGRGQAPWWALVIEGLLGIAAGVVTLVWPGITELALYLFIAWWAIATGIFEIVAAIRLRKVIDGEWALALSGVLSVLFGLALVLMPAAGFFAVALLIGAYSVAFGILMLVVAFRLRKLARYAPGTGAPGA